MRRPKTLTLSDDTGREIARSEGRALMGHPLAVVVWLTQHMAASGERLRKGDLLSLGSFSPLSPPQAGRRVAATCPGLADQPVSVRVSFR